MRLGSRAIQAPELGGAQTDIASTITSMLEAAEEEFTKLLADTEAAESAAVATFEKLSKDNAVRSAARRCWVPRAFMQRG